MERRYTAHTQHLRAATGCRHIRKISVDAGFTCPNRDGTLSSDGCTFCRNDAFTPSYCSARKSITRQIDEGMEFHAKRRGEADGCIVYFQSFSNTYAPLERLAGLYEEALRHPGVVGLVIGTRPDTVDCEKLDYIAHLARRHYVAVEYGIESTDDATLRLVNRRHDFAAARRAVEQTAARGIDVGAHFILGLPDQDRLSLTVQAATISRLPLSSVKFHRLQIFRSTPMADMWQREPERFASWSPQEYVDILADIIRRLPPSMAIERLSGEVPPRYLLTRPWHGVRSSELWDMLDRRMESLDARQGDMYRDE
ncbi:MAG: TIGR01212 family radical SAM protein [Alistipes sp.]|nr:TIGR01212 family radical SAM protein [Alistipes sp.]